MGFSGFSELKYKIRETMEQQETIKNEQANSLIEYVEYIKSKEYSDNIKKAAELIKCADSFQIFGLSVCRDIAKYTARRFCRAGVYCYGIDDINYPILDVPEGKESVIVIIHNFVKQKELFEVVSKYKSKNYTIIMVAYENVGMIEQLCDLVVYASNGIMKVGKVESGLPMLYTLERLTDEVTNK